MFLSFEFREQSGVQRTIFLILNAECGVRFLFLLFLSAECGVWCVIFYF